MAADIALAKIPTEIFGTSEKWPVFAQDFVSPILTSSFTSVNCGVASGASSPASKLFLFFRGPFFSDGLGMSYIRILNAIDVIRYVFSL
ncbi:hypothetical protein [Gynuella sunshinyii]|uniref:Uncharacterized protein n=1 Tax=Gynuella sunshinyii YC6258 TaxID=1445510 RepID=A0A0C5VUX8_9GAMM|nr:hypothetical protein [Gynuella sunshinyii]AJQ97941.1 hypothetical Protein YC6258_05917 [Gynuella sunshinyii YC6258]